MNPGMIWDGIVNKAQTAEGQGEIAFDIVTTVVTAGTTAAKAAKILNGVKKGADGVRLLDKVDDLGRAGSAVRVASSGQNILPAEIVRSSDIT